MGAANELWTAEVERLCEDFSEGRMERGDALKALVRIGFDAHEAEDMLEEPVG